jgi:hypothetical protein
MTSNLENLFQRLRPSLPFLLLLAAFLAAGPARAQFLDQGGLTGVIADPTGAIIPGASVTLTNPETGFIRKGESDASGVYIFSPIKIGNYTLTATAPGFSTKSQQNITVNLGQRATVNVALTAGAVSDVITVTDAPPLLQSQDSSTGQIFNVQEINDTPLNQRNVVYLAQLTSGVVPAKSSRANGTGDFDANGMRAEQNNFVLDGVDNNSVTADYLGGSSYLINPPPDALGQFKVSTSNYSAEYGHSAGALISASIKSGTNNIHGDVWEYFRNDYLDAHDWILPATTPNSEYRQNLFGATLGFPLFKNKLFFFGDLQNNRIVFVQPQSPITVPTALERTGDFSELLTASNIGASKPIQLYMPHMNQVKQTCPARATTANPTGNNVLCLNQIDPIAQNILNLYPQPNFTGNGVATLNYQYALRQPQFTFQWDTRVDYNPSDRDQSFVRFSFLNQRGANQAPLGPLLDGGGGNGSTNVSGENINYGNNFVLSETHIFSAKLVNEFRFAYDFGHFGILNPGYNVPGEATALGLGGVPEGPGFPDNGGLPTTTIGGITGFGAHAFRPEIEYEDEYQILDNVSWTLGNHSLRLGVSYQNIRSQTLEPPSSHPAYTFGGTQTSQPSVANTGYGVADFLTDNMTNGSIGPSGAFNDALADIAAYAQDDWRLTQKLTLNLGVRYEYFQPYKEMNGEIANFSATTIGIGTGTGIYSLPSRDRGITLNPAFLNVLAQDNIALQYNDNERLAQVSKLNFAPRVGFAYTANPGTVVRSGFGIFYQGQQQAGAQYNLSTNYPFIFSDSFPAPSCTAGSTNCANNGYTLETGFQPAITQGLTSFFSVPALAGQSPNLKTTYAMDYNLAVEQAFGNNFVFTLSYVGTSSRHLPSSINSNSTAVLLPSGTTQAFLPFPAFGASSNLLYVGESKYNSLQTKLQKRLTHGVDFAVNYTWAHALDDANDALGNTIGYRDPNIIPIRDDMTNSASDVRHRLTINGFYRLPVGRGQTYLNHSSRIVDALLGGYSTNLTYQVQTGQPFSVTSSNQTNVTGGSAYAVLVGNPFAPGGTPNPSNPTITCPTSVRNKAHWFNPCAFANPLPASLLTPFAKNGGNPNIPGVGYAYPSYITDANTAKLFLGGRSDSIYGPGFQKLDMSVFKHFATYESQYLEVRADCFNVLNDELLAQPATSNNSQTGGLITGARQLQLLTPNSRFFQVSAKYVF